ncbi:phage tail protein [Candidatus Electronema sp. PJ]|uniref:phage tail protein n=1 Tax=Candidatus Electronema sp. PJ TaxID=3401572 RepID=UPI003AA98058
MSSSPQVIDEYPPVAFYFSVVFGADLGNLFDNSFQEVSGLDAELETEDIAEGGENRFVHRLPKAIKHPRLILKRGLVSLNSLLSLWCKEVLEGDFSSSFTSKNIQIFLLGEQTTPLRAWLVENALPVKWEIEPFNSTKNDVAVEKIEFNYNILTRVM